MTTQLPNSDASERSVRDLMFSGQLTPAGVRAWYARRDAWRAFTVAYVETRSRILAAWDEETYPYAECVDCKGDYMPVGHTLHYDSDIVQAECSACGYTAMVPLPDDKIDHLAKWGSVTLDTFCPQCDQRQLTVADE